MITREQVADLQPGDVVEMTYDEYPETITRGPLHRTTDGRLWLARSAVVEENGEPVWNGHLRTLTLVSRAPRPLYVNHPRTEPVPGDIVRDADDSERSQTWLFMTPGYGLPWYSVTVPDGGPDEYDRDELPARLRLLVDGETGQQVPS